MKKGLVISFLLLITLVVGAFAYRDEFTRQFFRPTGSAIPNTPIAVQNEMQEPIVPLENLSIPWEIAFGLPNGDYLFTERSGKLYRVGELNHAVEVKGVLHRGEGGLLGLAVHPNFFENGWVYLYLTTSENGVVTNRVERYELHSTGSGSTLNNRTVIVDNIPGANYHDGGRIAFGPDGLLYITTGDAGKTANAQDTNSLAGKILRVDSEGSIPADNPFGNAVYSYGHRNVQGITWDSAGNLWATEHGRSGVQSGFDELNIIVKGGNYGWPELEGDKTKEGMIPPQLHSGASETWAPAGIAYKNGKVVFAGLRGESLYVADVSSGEARALKAYVRGEYGRLRTVSFGPDGMLYVLTSNRDGRGTPRDGDDKIIRIDPKVLGM